VRQELVLISSAARSAIEEHALLVRPFECCGLLSGEDEVITQAHPLRNEAVNPQTRYFASPQDLFAAMRRIRISGQKMLGVYHSHPRTEAYPSATDIEMAFYPEAVYFILSLEPRAELRAFKIDGARIENIEVSLVEPRINF
jgi:[CysO sulfur-carrier protein]-S-L-cysteine hydrolase